MPRERLVVRLLCFPRDGLIWSIKRDPSRVTVPGVGVGTWGVGAMLKSVHIKWNTLLTLLTKGTRWLFLSICNYSAFICSGLEDISWSKTGWGCFPNQEKVAASTWACLKLCVLLTIALYLIHLALLVLGVVLNIQANQYRLLGPSPFS